MKKVRYAVVGLGSITQGALVPGFQDAGNSELTALVTSDTEKREELAKRYGIEPQFAYSYEQYDECLKSGAVDAVYIGLPNHMHCDYTIRAAKAGIHVLCEKPMAVDERECERMMAACEESNTKLMIGYRLHFEEANLEAVRIASSGQLGDLRIFFSAFTQQVIPGNVRLEEPEDRGGGSVYDMGVYCINAARYLFRDEPIEVAAVSASSADTRFQKSAEMTTATLRFPHDRLASFTTSFGAAALSEFTLLGTRGWIRLSPAYDYQKPLRYELMVDGQKPQELEFTRRDQFGAELIYFSNCVLEDRQPEPSGLEGLADIRVIRAILKSARAQQPVVLAPFEKKDRPTKEQAIKKPVVKAPPLVKAAGPSAKK